MKKSDRIKHVPERTCIGCRQVRPKRELIRIFINDYSWVEIDHTERKSGRGTYLCKQQSCWEMGLLKNRLEHALRTQVTKEKRQELLEYSKTLPK